MALKFFFVLIVFISGIASVATPCCEPPAQTEHHIAANATTDCHDDYDNHDNHDATNHSICDCEHCITLSALPVHTHMYHMLITTPTGQNQQPLYSYFLKDIDQPPTPLI